MKYSICFLSVTLLFALDCAMATPYQIGLFPLADTWINSGRPNFNWGTSPWGWCNTDLSYTGDVYNILVKFNISALPTANIVSAYVNYQQQYIIGDEIVEPCTWLNVWETNSTWNEYDVTWNNAPNNLYQFLDYHNDYDITVHNFPVTTQLVNALTNSQPVISFRMHSDGQAVELFMREEADIFARPQLLINYSG